ncbi:MAG: GNAT family N-acetyltransferase [Xanthomonadaceae bacterium]|nr:GNAT family N-acetyltransferase [Xanthomonadaceae bacterium]
MLVEVDVLNKPKLDPLTYAEWGTELTYDQWIYREHEMGRTLWSQNHMRCWQWEDETGEVLSGFETYRMFTRDGGTIYGIASVVTPPKHRKKGYATRILAAGIALIESEDPSCRGFHLYSEVGSAIYERLGFVAAESFDYVLIPRFSEKNLGELKRVSHSEITNSPWQADSKSMIQVSSDQLHWHFTRERVYREMIRPWSLGLEILAGIRDSQGEVVWFVNNRLNYLQILNIKGDLSTKLISGIRDYAARLGLDEIKIWSTESISSQTMSSLICHQMITRERPDTIAMIRGIQPENWIPCSRSNWV